MLLSSGKKAVMISSFSGTFTGRFLNDGSASMAAKGLIVRADSTGECCSLGVPVAGEESGVFLPHVLRNVATESTHSPSQPISSVRAIRLIRRL